MDWSKYPTERNETSSLHENYIQKCDNNNELEALRISGKFNTPDVFTKELCDGAHIYYLRNAPQTELMRTHLQVSEYEGVVSITLKIPGNLQNNPITGSISHCTQGY